MIKLKLYKTETDKELFYYFNAKKEKCICIVIDTMILLVNVERSLSKGLKVKKAYGKLLEVKSGILNGNIKVVENEDISISSGLIFGTKLKVQVGLYLHEKTVNDILKIF